MQICSIKSTDIKKDTMSITQQQEFQNCIALQGLNLVSKYI